MPKPKTHAEHLAEYMLERLADGLAASSASATPEAVTECQLADVCIALQRVVGFLAGPVYEQRVLALLQAAGAVKAGDDHTYGDAARAIAEARVCAARDAAFAVGVTA